MKKLILILIFLGLDLGQLQAQNCDSLYNIHTDPRSGQQYMNIVGVPISALTYNNAIVVADRLYISDPVVNSKVFPWTASCNWYLRYPDHVDTSTTDYYNAISGPQITVPLDLSKDPCLFKPYIFSFICDSGLQINGRIKYLFQLTGK